MKPLDTTLRPPDRLKPAGIFLALGLALVQTWSSTDRTATTTGEGTRSEVQE